jgi:putative colanic acid biosynthesis acetyltransferase WcaF
MSKVDLSRSSTAGFDPGRPYPFRALWVIVEALVLLNPVVTSYGLKRWLLRRFGAHIGRNVIIKPGVHVKYPWRLSVGDNSWLGERCWIDNFVQVAIGANVCISQGAYLCTGNHDWSDPAMTRFVQPVMVKDGAWVAAFVRIAPGVTVGENAVISLGSTLMQDADADGIYSGNPASRVGERKLREPETDGPERARLVHASR